MTMTVERAKQLLGDVLEIHVRKSIYFGKVERIQEIHYLGSSKASLILVAPGSNNHVIDTDLADILKWRIVSGEWET